MLVLKRMLSDLLSLLFPNLCCGCGCDLFRGEELICTKCMYHLPYTDYHLFRENKAAKQLWGRLPCHGVMALLHFKKGGRTQQLIHSLKYKGRKDLCIKLGNMIAEKLQVAPDYAGIELIVPVPLHKSRQRKRGHNQSRFIAEGIASVLNLPLCLDCLLRKRPTRSQTKKGRQQRFKDMETAFTIGNAQVAEGRHVLLVDDVLTTGATLEACGIALLAAGVDQLSIAAIAYAE